MLTMQLKRDTLLERGKYRILATLGQGGFGITYLAEQALAGRKVCIKEYFPKDYYNRDADTNRVYIGSKADVDTLNRYKEKFIKEASVLARLKHPHIVSVYDVLEENDTAYYVMEHIEGESLGDVVKRRGALDEATAVGYIRQIADALGYIHEQNINHLDVKPANVMVSTKDDNAILIDFGLAKHYDTSGGQTSSTPVGISHGYAPFEQYKAGGVSSFSPATDIYSLGATLYYLVTGEVPPSATDIGKDGIKTPDNLSPGVQRAIKEAMNYWREERPQSVKEFLKLLDDDDNMVVILDVADDDTPTEKPITEPTHKLEPTPKSEPKPKSQPTPAPKGGGRKWLWVMLFVALIVVVATFFVLGDSSSKKENAPKSAVAMVDTLQLNDTLKEQPKEEPKEEAMPSEPVTKQEPPTKEPKEEPTPSETNTETETKPESPTKEDAKPEATKPVTQPNNEIWYTSSDGKVVKPKDVFGAVIESNTYKNGKGILKFQGDVTTIGKDALYRCDNLTSVTIPNSVTTIGESAFRGCDNLTSVTIPNSVTTIGDYAFNYCSNLTSVTIPNRVTTIGREAFDGCKSLTSVTIPNSVTTIGHEAFCDCISLKEFKGKYAADGGRCLIKDNIIIAYANASGATYDIPNSVTKIGYSAFYRCDNLTSVTIPKSVTTIEANAFNQCKNLTSITIPNSVTTIGSCAFSCCESLTNITIPNSVTTIGRSAFFRCESLISITIPNSVTTIGETAFCGCNSLKEFKGKYAADGGRCLIKDNIIIAYANASGATYDIPNSVTTIGEEAFYGCDNLTSVTIPNSVTTIEADAFINCESLTSITIPNSVTTIGSCAFLGCKSLKSVTIPNSVTTIGDNPFRGCNSLKEFKGKYAADGGRCLIKDNIIIAYANASGSTYAIPNSVTTIGKDAFFYCDNLTSVTIPNSVTTIEFWAFAGCKNLSKDTKDKIREINPDAL